MLSFKKVILHNFGSYGHAETNLENKGICLVSGRNNYKKDNALSNGSGKSFLWSGICYALTGETISGLRSNLKNINASEDAVSYVTVEFLSDADSYTITRHIAPKSDLKISKNDIDISGKGLRESEKKLGEVLPDLTKDLIASTIIIGQGMPNKFSSFSPSGRKDLLEKLTKSDFMVEDIRQRVTTRLTELQRQIRDCEDSLLIHRTQNKTIENTLKVKEAELAKAIKPDFTAQLAELTQLITDCRKQLEVASAGVAEKEKSHADVNAELLKLLETSNAEAAEEKEAYEAAFRAKVTERSQKEAEVKTLTRTIAELKAVTDTCPTCGQKLPGAVKPDTTVQETALVQLNIEIEAINKKVSEINTKHWDYQLQIKTKYESTIEGLKLQLRTLATEKGNLQREVQTLTARCTEYTEKYNKIIYDQENWDKYYARLQAEITSLQEEWSKNNSLILLLEANKQDIADHLAVVKKMETLTKRDFRGYLLENIIKYIDQVAKDYCDIVFKTRDLEVYLDGNALDISYCGKMFDNLSGGEKQRVDLILQFAIRNMLNAYLNTSSNILVLDEITDFLDKQSCKAIMTLIEKELTTIESVFVVSHHATELELPIDSEIKVVKNEDGISEIL
jgi:DNA repair exonuclease SbcCD ATPase subunit